MSSTANIDSPSIEWEQSMHSFDLTVFSEAIINGITAVNIAPLPNL